MRAVSALIALGVLSASPAFAAEPADSARKTERTAPSATEPSREALGLARQFASMFYPAEQQTGWIEELRAGPPEDYIIQDVALRHDLRGKAEKTAVKLTRIVELRLPELMDAYAHSYAREYSESELRDLIAFAATSSGRHFMHDMDFADGDEAVTAVRDEMSGEMAPILEDLQKAICQAATEVRVAAGETEAKCSMS